MKISNFSKMLGKIGLNAEAQEIAQMEKIPVDVYKQNEDGFVGWFRKRLKTILGENEEQNIEWTKLAEEKSFENNLNNCTR